MAQLIDGKTVSQEVLDDVAKDLKQIRDKHPRFNPTLAIVQVTFATTI